MNALSIAAFALAGVALLALAAAAALLWRLARQAGTRLGNLQAQVTRLLEVQQAIDARIETLAALVRDEQTHTALAQPATGRSYELAAHLASSGAGPEQLVAQCGLTPAEAELAIRIHGLGARTRAASEW
jgi:hypothetical protein